MSLFSKLFGGGGKSSTPAEEHDGFQIYAEPQSDAGGYRVAARIEKEIDGEVKTHQMIRADICASPDEANRITVMKAKALIDEQGEAIFR